MTTLARSVDTQATVLQLDSALDVGSLPAPYRLDSECVLVTGGDLQAQVYVSRAQFGTAAAAHAVGTSLTTGWGGSVTPAAFVEPTTATPEQIANALIAAGLMEAS